MDDASLLYPDGGSWSHVMQAGTTRGLSSDQELSADTKSAILLPVVVYEVVLGLVGLAGNLAVVVVGLARVKASVTSRLVVLLAGVDLAGLVACVPGDVAESLLPLHYDFPALCKTHRLIRSTTTVWSGLLLLAIAADRHRRICRPVQAQLSLQAARRAGAALGVGALLLSLPSLAVFGSTPKTAGTGQNGTGCGVEARLRDTPWPAVFFGSLCLLFLTTASSLAVIYILIAKRIWRGRKLRTDARSHSTASLPDVVLYSTVTSRRGDPRDSHVLDAWSRSLPRRSRLMSLTPTASLRRQRSNVYSRRKTTFILLAMTATFIASCLPYLVISVCRLVVPEFDPTSSPALETLFFIGLRSFLISSAVNPFIYGFCNHQFRRDFVQMAQKRCCKKAEEESPSQSAKASGHT